MNVHLTLLEATVLVVLVEDVFLLSLLWLNLLLLLTLNMVLVDKNSSEV